MADDHLCECDKEVWIRVWIRVWSDSGSHWEMAFSPIDSVGHSVSMGAHLVKGAIVLGIGQERVVAHLGEAGGREERNG